MFEMRAELNCGEESFPGPLSFYGNPLSLSHPSSPKMFSSALLPSPPKKIARPVTAGGRVLPQGCCHDSTVMIPLYCCNQGDSAADMVRNCDNVASPFASSRQYMSREHLYLREKCDSVVAGNPRTWCHSHLSQENGIMEEGKQQDAAINLSTGREGKESVTATTVANSVVNGDVRNGDSHHEPLQVPSSPQASTPSKNSASLIGAAKRKLKSVSDSLPTSLLSSQSQQPLLMMAAQHGLSPQQVQQLLQQQGVSPGQLQQMMTQQSLMLQHQQQQQQQQKLHEGMLHQLNEQLQLNVLQQSQLIQQQQQDKQKSGKHAQQQLQQLALQQQQLIQQIQQIQLQQRQYLLACLVQPFGGVPQGMMSPAEIQQLWKEVAAQSGLDEPPVKNGLTIPTIPSVTNSSLTAATPSPVIQAPNYSTNGGIPIDGFLLPGITPISQSSPISIRHAESAKSVNNELTNGLSPPSNPLFRHSVCKWPGCDTHCEDFTSFSKHLNSEHILDDRSTAQARVQMQVVSQLEIQLSREKEMLQAMMQHLHMKPPQRQLSPQLPASQPPQPPPPLLLQPPKEPKPEPVTLNTPTIIPKHSPVPLTTAPPHPVISMVTSPVVAMAPTLTPSSQLPPVSQASAGSPVSSNGSAPGSIRRRVSDKCNLPISAEIQRNRDFYKNTDVRPPFTYASLIRQAIIESPHRQLTLNEIYQWFQNTFAYFRRNEATWKNAVRHNLSLHKCFMRVENVKGAVWTVDEVEFYKRRPQKLTGSMKSPSLSDPSSYNETLNASLRAALGEASIAMLTAAQNQLSGQESAEDLSMKSLSNSRDGCSPTREEEMMLLIKQEPGPETDSILKSAACLEEQSPEAFLPVEEEEAPVSEELIADDAQDLQTDAQTDSESALQADDPEALVMADVEEKAVPEDMSMEEDAQVNAQTANMVVDEEAEGMTNGEAESCDDPEMLALSRMQQEANKMVAASHSNE